MLLTVGQWETPVVIAERVFASRLVFTEDGRQLVGAMHDGSIRVWELAR